MDCSRTIFVLTTNAMDPVIMEYVRQHPEVQHTRGLKTLKLKAQLSKLTSKLKACAMHEFGVG